jgi:hypothetical protein
MVFFYDEINWTIGPNQKAVEFLYWVFNGVEVIPINVQYRAHSLTYWQARRNNL